MDDPKGNGCSTSSRKQVVVELGAALGDNEGIERKSESVGTDTEVAKPEQPKDTTTLETIDENNDSVDGVTSRKFRPLGLIRILLGRPSRRLLRSNVRPKPLLRVRSPSSRSTLQRSQIRRLPMTRPR